MTDYFSGVLFGLITMFALGIAAAVIQGPARKIGAIQSVVLRNGVLVLGVLAGLLSGLFSYQWDPAVLIPVLGLGILGYVALQFFYKGLGVGKVGVVVPIASSYPLITVLLAVVFFGEALSFVHAGAIALIILGSIFLSARVEDWKKPFRIHINEGVVFALLTCVGWGIWYFYSKVPVSMVGPILTSLLVELAIFLVAGFHFAISKQKWISIDWKLGKWVVLAGILGAIGSFSYNFGIRIADVSLVVAFAACTPLVSTLFAYVAYQQRLTSQQWVAIFLKVLGIVLLSISL